MDFDRIEDQFRVNSMGPLRVTYALLGNLRAGSKVFIISSRMGSVADNGSGGYYGYRMSKVCFPLFLMMIGNDSVVMTR
jgi:NAD(P)-dependent dehydrogenase (short-subunit alcohol dehydrogenase family)